MITATWTSLKSSPMMKEIHRDLKMKTPPGEATLSRKVANRTWREDILGIRSDEQKQADKARKQERNNKKKTRRIVEDEE